MSLGAALSTRRELLGGGAAMMLLALASVAATPAAASSMAPVYEVPTNAGLEAVPGDVDAAATAADPKVELSGRRLPPFD